ncbi:MAG: TonB-dependent receptor plug domain-containing protein, partial [Paludibacteraceae bacterium]|nr:TonB-dependent receptor plug domain-containing protein [Paludibacteraceae bacterium]
MKKLYIIVALLGLIQSVYAEKLVGTIIDGFTREPLIGVTILDKETGAGTVTDLDGHYELNITSLPAKIQFSYVGYQTEEKVFKTIPAKFDLMLQANNEVLEEVVVTAGRFEQRMTDVTVSMELLKPDALRSQAPTDLSATLQTLPGVEVIDKQPSIRGGGGWTYSVGSRCQVLMDGMTILNPKTGEINWNNVPLENVAQVEVVKGASSVLYGSSALNGVINVRTQRPGLNPETKLSAYVGIYDNYTNYKYTGARL